MACFITPLATGILLLYLSRAYRPMKRTGLNALILMLIGGSILLMAEHVWNGELTIYPPFLTAMRDITDIYTLLHELTIVGGCMTAATSMTWALMIMVARVKPRLTTLLRYTRVPVSTKW